MAFKNVYLAVVEQLQTNSNLLTYIHVDNFVQGFKESLSTKKYAIIFEPGPETEVTQRQANVKGQKILELEYEIQIYCRMILVSNTVKSAIIGNETNKGLLDFVDDVKAAIREDMSFSYNTYGRSLSVENAAGSFDLDSSNRYLSVSIDDKTPTGYDTVFCGDSTLAGAVVAANIQASLRQLGQFDDDGYKLATCTFNATTNQFTINSPHIGPSARVVVTAGASDDASAELGFTTPTEYRGTNIIKTTFGSVTPENKAFPVRFRMLPLLVTEETLIGG